MNDSAQRPSAQDRRLERTPSSRPEQASDDGLPTGTDPPREAGNTNKGDPADAGPAESGNHAGQDGDTSSDVEEEENHGPTGLSDTDRIVVDHAGILNVYVEDRRAGGVYVSGGSVRSDLLAGRDARITRAGTDGETSVPMVSVSAVSAEELTRLRAVTVRVTCHEDAVAILKQDRFVLLSGPPGTGKRAGGVALFSDPPTILDIDPSVTLGSLFEFTTRISQPGAHHYIIESLIPETARSLNEFAARELTSQLTEADAYLVITVDNRVPLDRDVLCHTVAWHSRPEPVEALRRHLTFYLSATAAEEVLRQLPMVDLQPHLAEREMRLTDRLARRVSRAFQHGTGLEDAISSLGLGARRQVEEWFEHDRSISDVSFLLACAVLGGCAYTTVSAHATRIERLLADASRVDLTQLPQLMTRPRSQRLSAVMAKLGSGLVNMEFGASVTETVTLESAPLVRAVLDVVWHEYDLVAEALLQWILAAGDDRDPDVRVRVAFAAGQLAEYDFADIRSRLLLPWAKSEGVGPRGTAAFALGVPVNGLAFSLVGIGGSGSGVAW